jgi:hypothetical protein
MYLQITKLKTAAAHWKDEFTKANKQQDLQQLQEQLQSETKVLSLLSYFSAH